MHIVLAIVYGLTAWFAALAYTLILRGPVGWVLLAGPFIISGAIAVLLALDIALDALVRKAKQWFQ